MLLEEMASKISKQDTHKHSYFVGRILDSLAYEHICQRLLVGYIQKKQEEISNFISWWRRVLSSVCAGYLFG